MESVGEPETWVSASDRKAHDAVFQLCRRDDWKGVLERIERDPSIATATLVMDNNITTTCLHQAITSKANIQARAAVIRRILELAPQAAQIKNGYGSLPLHVIAQRNTKMKSETKEELIVLLVHAYPEALVEEGGVGKRTPLHIIFTDYVSPRLTQLMVDQGAQACFMKDKKGYLPAHVAASRHCSPEKLRMLLSVNPDALRDRTADGQTLMSLATSTATKSHPNYALIDELHRQHSIASTASRTFPLSHEASGTPPSTNGRVPPYIHRRTHFSPATTEPPDVQHGSPLKKIAVSGSESNDSSPSSRDRLNSNDSHAAAAGWPSPPRSPYPLLQYHPGRAPPDEGMGTEPSAPRKKRKSSRDDDVEPHPLGHQHDGPVVGPYHSRVHNPYSHWHQHHQLPAADDPVGLLLHFSQTATSTSTTAAGAEGTNPRFRMRNRNDLGLVWGGGNNTGGEHYEEMPKEYLGEGDEYDDDASSSPMNYAQV